MIHGESIFQAKGTTTQAATTKSTHGVNYSYNPRGGYRKSTNKKTSRVEQGDYIINVRPITVGEERKGHMGQWGVVD